MIKIGELIMAFCSILALAFSCPPEEVVDDIVDRFARGEMTMLTEFLKGD